MSIERPRSLPLLLGGLLLLTVFAAFPRPAAAQTPAPEAGAPDPGQQSVDLAALEDQLKSRPGWTEGWWKLGTAAYGIDQYGVAVRALDHVVRAAPRMGIAWSLLGLSQFELKQYPEAQASLQQAATLNNVDDDEVKRVAAYHLSLLRIRDRQFQSAADLLRQTFASDDNQQADLALGLATLEIPLLPSEINPSHEALLVQVGKATARGPAGLPDLAATAAANPDVPQISLAYGRALASAGQNREALAAFRHAVSVSPQDAEAWKALAQAEAQAGDTHASTTAQAKAVALAGNHAAEGARVRQWFAAPSAAHAEPADFTAAMRAYAAGDFQTAAQTLARWVAAQPNDGTAWAVLGLSEFHLHQFDDALLHLERGDALGLRGDPQATAEARYTLGLLLLRAGSFDPAAHQLKAAQDTVGTNPQIDTALGFVLLRRAALPGAVSDPLAVAAGKIESMLLASRYDEALPAFRSLLQQHPDTPFLHYAYANALIALSEFDQAAVEMKAEAKLSSTSPLPFEGLASIALRQDHPQDAIADARRALALKPAAAEPHYLLGRALLESGASPADAVAELQQAARLDPNSPEVHFSLARAYARASDPKRAAEERATFVRLHELAEGQGSGQPQVYTGPRNQTILSGGASPQSPQ